MKKLAISMSLVLGLSGMGLSSAANAFEGNAEAGKTKSAMCAACHGPDGNSTIDMYPKIAGQHPEYIFALLQALKLGMTSGGKEGRNDPVMSAMTLALSEQDMKDLAAFYAGNEMTEGTTPEEVVVAGKKLYTAGDAKRGIPACTACHGPRGTGMALAGFPKIAFQHANYNKISLEKFRDGTRNNDKNGMMRDIAAKLTDKDIEILTKYLGGLH
ncbi:MAG: cytochrome c4 [Psychrosphaera sp.]|nr:cytochrome c4 [Psychrosphaera sp.]